MHIVTARSNCLISDLAIQPYLAMSAFNAPSGNLLRHLAGDRFLIFPFGMNNAKQAGGQLRSGSARGCTRRSLGLCTQSPVIQGRDHLSRSPAKSIANKTAR
jgi:hypothetical protein